MKILKINAVGNIKYERFAVKYPHRQKNKEKTFRTMKEALDFACLHSEMINVFDPDILEYAKKTNHYLIRHRSLEFV